MSYTSGPLKIKKGSSHGNKYGTYLVAPAPDLVPVDTILYPAEVFVAAEPGLPRDARPELLVLTALIDHCNINMKRECISV